MTKHSESTTKRKARLLRAKVLKAEKLADDKARILAEVELEVPATIVPVDPLPQEIDFDRVEKEPEQETKSGWAKLFKSFFKLT